MKTKSGYCAQFRAKFCPEPSPDLDSLGYTLPPHEYVERRLPGSGAAKKAADIWDDYTKTEQADHLKDIARGVPILSAKRLKKFTGPEAVVDPEEFSQDRREQCRAKFGLTLRQDGFLSICLFFM